MPWVRKDDRMPWHRKIAPLSDAAYRLHDEAICWSSSFLTDGRISAADLSEISKRGRPKLAAELVARGLWHSAGQPCESETCPPAGIDGWTIHDYWAYQPSKAKVLRERDAKTKRQQRWLDTKRGHTDATTDASRDASKDAAPPRTRPAPKEGGGGAPAATARRQAANAGGGQQQQPTATSPPTELLNGVRAQLRTATHKVRQRAGRRENAIDELRALTDPQPETDE